MMTREVVCLDETEGSVSEGLRSLSVVEPNFSHTNSIPELAFLSNPLISNLTQSKPSKIALNSWPLGR